MSLPALGPSPNNDLSHAYSGKVPNNRSVVRHFARSPARAATDGIDAGSLTSVLMSGFGDVESSLDARWAGDGSLGWR
jgi:hypothetical protein